MITNVSRSAAGVFRQVRRTPRHMRLPPFRQVPATQPSSIIVPLGVTYHRIFFRFTIAGVEATEAQIKTQVTKIKATIDGDPKIDLSATELLAIMNLWNGQRNGTNWKAGTITLHLARPWEQEIVAQDGPAWGCAVDGPGAVRAFNLEVTLGAGATIDLVEAFGEVTEATPLGRHFCVRRIADAVAAIGDKVLSDWPSLSPEVAWYSLHIDKTGGAGNQITDIALKIDQVEEIERTNYGHIQAQLTAYGLQQQAGFLHIPFARRGRPMDALPVVFQDARLIMACSAAFGNYNVLIETQEGVDPSDQ